MYCFAIKIEKFREWIVHGWWYEQFRPSQMEFPRQGHTVSNGYEQWYLILGDKVNSNDQMRNVCYSVCSVTSLLERFFFILFFIFL